VAAQSLLETKYARLSPHLNERQRRLVAAADAQLLGRGGISRVSVASGLSRTTIHRGLRELQGDLLPDKRVREAGGGRKQIKQQQPAVLRELEQLVAPTTPGDPMSPLRWTCKSTSKLAAELSRKGYPMSARTVARLLEKDLDYSLQANRKTKELRYACNDMGAQEPCGTRLMLLRLWLISRRPRRCRMRPTWSES